MKNKEKLTLIIGSLLGLIVVIAVLIYFVKIVPKQKEKDLQNFKSYTSSLQLPGKAPLYIKLFTTGCFRDDSGYGYTRTCSFAVRQFYILDGSFRSNATAFEAYLKSQGYEFTSENIQAVFHQTISQTNIADELSNATPLGATFINRQQKVEASLTIGDKKRLNPRGPIGLPNELFNSISDHQLMSVLEFSQTHK